VTQKFQFVVGQEDRGLRLDQVLAKRVPHLSRNAARKVLSDGGVFVGKNRVKVASRAVEPGQKISVSWLEGEAQKLGERPEIPIVHEDDEVLVIDKPEGLLSAPSQVSDRNNALRYLSDDRSAELFLVHRLDRPTSGLMLFAKTKSAAHDLSVKFQAHDVERCYKTVVWGTPISSPLLVDEPIDGRPAKTTFTLVETWGQFSLLEANLSTGRTHQVRRHALAMGHPILGDRVYRGETAGSSARETRLMLHAYVLGFRHPASQSPMRFMSPPPADFYTHIRPEPPQFS
jgi:23S rRNA pseudouridine1911/1915/1917 synthase